MIGLALAVFLQMAAPQTADAVAQDTTQTAAAPSGGMSCNYKNRRLRTCTTPAGEVLRCQKQPRLGSRFETWVCLTYREDQTIQRDSRESLDRQQHITTPGGG